MRGQIFEGVESLVSVWLQGSVQVYGRKVEYLYSLVLRALEFLSQKRQEEQLEGTSDEPRENAGSQEVAGEENDSFWGLDDIPVEAKNCLDTQSDEDAHLNNFVKPPANLVVLEGDCLDSGGDAGELESYLLATSDLYRGFILLDPCDAEAVHDYLDGDKAGREQNSAHKGSTVRKSFRSPNTCSGGVSHKSSIRKGQDPNINQSPLVDCSFDVNNSNVGPDPPAPNMFNNGNSGYDMDHRHFEPGNFDDSDDDEDDPWKPLNPHEPGNAKVKPFRKVKAPKRNMFNSTKGVPISTLFPPARLRGTISPELRRMWEMRNNAHEKRKRRRESQSLPLYEKLRQQLANYEGRSFDTFLHPEDGNEEDENHTGVPEFEQPENDIPEFMDNNIPFHNEQHDGDGANFGFDDPFGHEDANSQANLEDLCRSHLDALLASIAETEKQSELAARVTTWKQKIEHNLDEQESHPEFDIHCYGERILDKLSLNAEDRNVLSFSDVVKGEEKYDVARSFSALLQLVNNGDVELDRNGVDGSVCFTAAIPFHVRLLRNDKRREKAQFRLSRKRVKSPARIAYRKGDNENVGPEKLPAVDSSQLDKSIELPSQPNGKFSMKVGKLGVGALRCTPEGKRRRSRLVEPVDLHSSG